MKRIIKFGEEAREKLLEGVELSTKAIKPTLGPRGASAIIYTGVQPFPLLADDGAIVAKCIQSPDQAVNAGCAIIKEVATQTDNGGGDGTSSATIIAHHIIKQALAAINSGVSKRNLKQGITEATEMAKDAISKITKKIETEDQLKNVAYISSNDHEIAELVGSAVYKVGPYGVVQVEEGSSQDTEVINAAGIKFERGFIDRYLTTDPVRGVFQANDCRILLLDHELDSAAEAIKILELAVTKGVPMLIVCNGCRNEAVLAYMHANKKQYGLNICMVKAPGHGDLKKQYIQDIAAATGATVFGDATGVSLDKLKVTSDGTNGDNSTQYMKLLGTGKVTVVQHATTIVVDKKTPEAIEAAEAIKKELDRTDLTAYDRNIYEERYANLTSGISLIKVGGSTDTEIAARKVKIDDAKNATMSAHKYGYVIGGGSAYLWAAAQLQKYLEGKNETPDAKGQLEGMRIVMQALHTVTKQLLINSGVKEDGTEYKEIVDTMLTQTDPTKGFDAISNKVVDMYDAGIIDSAKVVTNSLDKAASIASTVIMAETLITEEAEPEDKINYSLLHRK